MRKSKKVGILLLVAGCAIMVANVSWARRSPRGVSEEEIKKIKEAMPAKAFVEPAKPRKILVFNLCQGFRHSSIPYWDKALEIMAEKTGAFSVEFSNDLTAFKAENLKEFDAVCFNNTTDLELSLEETPALCKGLMDFVKNGKGIIGIHAATDNFKKWPEAQEMMGGTFTGHPWTSNGTWAIKIDEPDHPLMEPFEGKSFKINDEIYRTEPPLYSRSKQLVLMSLDMSDEVTKKTSEKPSDADTGISWIKSWGNGRMFYCSLGHVHAVTWTKPVLEHYLRGIQFALGDLRVDTEPKPTVNSEMKKGTDMATLQELQGKIKTYDWGQSRLALTEMSDMIKKAHSSPMELKRIEKGLLGILTSDATRAGKQFVCRELSIIGTEQSVPVLAKMLTDEETSDMARYALERIPNPAADDALRKALPKAKGKPKIGIINSLGQRRDKGAVEALSTLMSNSDEMTATAAAAALGMIADSKATEALAGAKDKVKGALRMQVLDSYLMCADQLVADGNKVNALAIYKELQKGDMPKPIKTAALTGMLKAMK